MVWETVHELTVALSLATGAVALVLCLLAVEILRRSPFGRVVVVLTVVIALFNVYHLIALLSPDLTLLIAVAKSVTLTGVLVFVVLTVHLDMQMRANRKPGDQ